MDEEELEKRIELAAKIIKKSNFIVAFTGAGISTESGIPDFRGKDGLWKKIDPKTATLEYFLEDPSRYWSRYLPEKKDALSSGLGDIMSREPNSGHLALAELEKMGKLKAIITQNIDSLHQKAQRKLNSGNCEIIELHGTVATCHCMDCGEKESRESVISRVRDGDLPPKCLRENCNGLMKTDTILFGESLPQEAMIKAHQYSQRCDCMIVLGSTLTVYPAASYPHIASQLGAKIIIINLDETVKDHLADIVLHGKIGNILPKITEKVKEFIKT
ncbi:MAG: NAD-dependent protein deacylase [Candidatus Helarchaeota archaeon]